MNADVSAEVSRMPEAPEVSVAMNQGRGIVKGITAPKVEAIRIEPLKRLSVR